jgi:integrase
MAKWNKECDAAVAAAAGRPVTVPPMPELMSEEPTSRTIEAFAQQLGEMLTWAYKKGLSPQPLWTEDLKDEVPRPAATNYTTRTVPSREKVAEIVNAMHLYARPFRFPGGTTTTVTGARYAAMVWFAAATASRPEEYAAVRDSWVILDPDDPRIVFRHAEIIVPAIDGQARHRAQVPLKGRDEHEQRVFRPDPSEAAEFIAVLSAHRRDFVDTDSEDDPYFFTTHNGNPIDMSNWNDDWWKPVRDDVLGGDKHLAAMPPRRLRAAGITHWLINLDWNTYKASEQAGNTQSVLEKNYKGVLAERRRTTRTSRPPVPARLPSTQIDTAAMTPAQLEAAIAEVLATGAAARQQLDALQAAQRAQLTFTT